MIMYVWISFKKKSKHSDNLLDRSDRKRGYLATWCTFKPKLSQKTLKKLIVKKSVVFLQKMFFLDFGKWNFLALKNVLLFLKKAFLMFRKMELFKKTSYISEGDFAISKNKKIHSEKIYYISGNGTFLPQA